ncbi:MAG: O-antigen ligase family protein [Isosphaeraceae bacterium]
MARRNQSPAFPGRPNQNPRPSPNPGQGPAPGWFDLDPETAGRLGERCRRLALGLTASLVCARFFWTGEFATEAETGSALIWVAALLIALGLTIAGAWLQGSVRLRLSRTDAALVALVALVGMSASHAAERRMAINLAWEWTGMALAYVLLRTLPRTKGESSILAGALVATAVAVAGYGLYQVTFELPEIQRLYLRHPERVLAPLGIDPASTARKLFEDRLLGSREPWSTYALANSLAGFLVGASAVGIALALGGLLRKDRRGVIAVALASLPGTVLVYCLILTKSRSAFVGLAAALLVLAWRERRRFSTKALVLAGIGTAGTLAILAALATALGGLDVQVLTESPKSLRYRWEYWQGAAGVIGEHPFLGHGPGNFGGPYLRHKLPEASEQITDPHNLVLEVLATAGLPGAIALLAVLGLGLRDLFGPARKAKDQGRPESLAEVQGRGSGPPRSAGWLLACAGGSLLMVVALGRLDPITNPGDLIRWVALAAGWALAVALAGPLWRLETLGAASLGAGALAVSVNLLGAGGIGIPTVALGLWALLAIGQNLRVDRLCGQERGVGGRWVAFGMAAVWAALVGSFIGAVGPYWRMERRLEQANTLAATRGASREKVAAAYLLATQADDYSLQPWIALAEYEFKAWLARGGRGADRTWPILAWVLDQAAALPRNPGSLAVPRLRARFADEFLRKADLPESEAQYIRQDQMTALARLTSLDPTNAALHAELAQVLATLNQVPLANREAREALRLDRLTPHLDKKLPAPVREALERDFPLRQDPTPAAAEPPSK